MERITGALLLIKAETPYGTDAVPVVTANLVPPADDSLTFDIDSTPIQRRPLIGSHSRLPGFNTLPNVTLKFRYELRGNRKNATTELDISNGTSTQAIEIDPLLKAADLSPTYTAAVTPGAEGVSAGSRDGYVTYKPALSASSVGTSVTCYWYSGLKLHKLLGGKVDFEIVFEAGKMAYIDFTIRGKYALPTDVALPTANLSWLKTKPALYEPSVLTIGTYSPVVSMLKIKYGAQIAMRKNAAATNGIEGFVISEINPSGEFNPESVAEATNPFWSDWINSVVNTLTTTHGGSVGNKFTGTFGVEYKGMKYANADKLRVHSTQFDIVMSDLSQTIGNEFQLKFF